ncbi:putative holin-like toxin [Butyricicoccus sp.]
MTYVTYQELIQFCTFIVAVIGLTIQIMDHNKK